MLYGWRLAKDVVALVSCVPGRKPGHGCLLRTIFLSFHEVAGLGDSQEFCIQIAGSKMAPLCCDYRARDLFDSDGRFFSHTFKEGV